MADSTISPKDAAAKLAAKRAKARAYSVEYRKKYPEKAKAADTAWKAAHPDWVKARAAKWHLEHRDREKVRMAAWRLANLDRERTREAEYKAANPERVKLYARRRRARNAKATGRHTVEDIQAILKQQRHRCAYCRSSIKRGYDVDHITPLSRGGSNDRRNLQLLCELCNCRKGAKHPVAFAQQIGLLI